MNKYVLVVTHWWTDRSCFHQAAGTKTIFSRVDWWRWRAAGRST